ncbi:MAG: hypothetical protein ACKO1J_08115 [Tagaea sp.]
MQRFLTLGPGTNHDVVVRRLLAFHGADSCPLGFVENAPEGFELLLAGRAEFFVLCSVHPRASRLLCEYAGKVFIVDTFIAPSKKLAILSRAGVARPRKLGLFEATVGLAPTARWQEVVVETDGTLATVGAKLLAGVYDSALTYRDLADAHSDELTVDAEIESPDDAWLVLARDRAAKSGLVASRTGAVARALAAGHAVRDGNIK